MSTVSQIVRLRHPGVLNAFDWSSDLQAFADFNLLYGWNGTGKTTISRLFRALELRKQLSDGDATLKISGHDVPSAEFSQVQVNVRVFNRDYVAESVFMASGVNVPPIFVVGKENVEQQKEIEALKEQVSQATAALQAAKAASREAERHLDRYCVERAKSVKDLLRSSGTNPYNNYDKAAFQRDVQPLARTGGNADSLTDDDRERLLSQARATLKAKLPELTFTLPDVRGLGDSVLPLLARSITAAVVSTLKSDPRVADWVGEGLKLHRERHSENCIFCTQQIPAERLKAIEAHFSDDFAQQMRAIESEIAKLKSVISSLSSFSLPSKAELYDHVAGDFADAQHAINDAIAKIVKVLSDLVGWLEQKRKQPFDVPPFAFFVPEFDRTAIERMNSLIREHNNATDEFDSRVRTARQRLAASMVTESVETYRVLAETADKESSAAQSQQGDIDRMTATIGQLQRDIVKHRRPAEELNQDLRAYLGHDELTLEVQEAGYLLTRKGKQAASLSEGETTAIALLYFLKSLKDERFDRKNGIVVLDDPVSSLDANALYLAFGFIRERTEGVSQLFILTHNFSFFRQVKNWFDYVNKGKKKDQKPARFYMLECEHSNGRRTSQIRPLDRLLERYQSEYHYLFARIYRAASEQQSGLEENYVFPNIGRRLLEAFLAFRQPEQVGELWQKLKKVKFDEAKKLRLIRFFQTHSHGDTIGEPEHDPTVLGETKGVLKDLLELISSQDKDHFDAMVKLTTEPASASR